MNELKNLFTVVSMIILLIGMISVVVAETSGDEGDYSISIEDNRDYSSRSLISNSNFKIVRTSTTLRGFKEVPKTRSNAFGVAEFLIDTQSNQLLFSVIYSGLEGNETGAHIHGPANAGMNAPILFALPSTSGYKTGAWNYPESLERDILKGRTYINIHSTKYPGGEIRGQIMQNKVFSFKIIRPVLSVKTHRVNIINFTYVPSELKIAEGDTVIWHNLDFAPHTVTSDTGTELNSASIPLGGSYSHTFDDDGDNEYHCTIHPRMQGSIIVGDNY